MSGAKRWRQKKYLASILDPNQNPAAVQAELGITDTGANGWWEERDFLALASDALETHTRKVLLNSAQDLSAILKRLTDIILSDNVSNRDSIQAIKLYTDILRIYLKDAKEEGFQEVDELIEQLQERISV